MTRREFLKMGAASLMVSAAMGQQPAPNDRLTCAFIGVGGRGSYLLNTVLDNLTDVDVVAVCDINPERLKNAAQLVEQKRGKRPEAIGGRGERDNFAYRKLLERKDIDTLVIATPCNWHYPMYVDAIKAGKHFYGEKPMCISVKEADEIVALARKNPKVVITIGYQWCANPRFQEAIAAVKKGEIGELIEGRSAWDNAWGPLRGWFSHRRESGDWMVEQACHTWNIYYLLLGETPVRAFAIGRRDIYARDEPRRDVTDFYATVIEWRNFWLTFVHTWGVPQGFGWGGLWVLGTQGACEISSGRLLYKDKPERRVGYDVNDTLELLRDFFNCVRTGKKPLSSVENGRTSVLIGLLVRLAVDKRGLATWKELTGIAR